MKYYMFRLSFPYGVHFGDGNLDSSNMGISTVQIYHFMQILFFLLYLLRL